MSDCKCYQKSIERYIEGCLEPAEQDRLSEHIKHCAACKNEYAQAKSVAVILKESLTFGLPCQQGVDGVMASIAEIRNRKTASKHNRLPVADVLGKIAAGILLIAAIGLAFAAGRFWHGSSSIDAARTAYHIQSLEGTVLVRHPGTDTWQPLVKESAIYVGDEFLSTPESKMIFAVDKKSFITLSENSMLVLRTVKDTTELYLANGSLDASLESPHGPFFVTTPHGRAEAMGTEFTINVK